eukprot:CAMPEP_0174290078 /NCGR_PEP_ID=MMETSP0809-20121228/27490_1 /TAXON_ID=73025 ORGANISM="Eutreptiella gymnastica-like, Strain CCMP1594" /NCGR_SAMPLE_ID=MMETSP0809 /ASSEMBLY_ACC=CAM_ASM_000658 /LENGTH=75 /DNA_ID=CAMNT_0015388475 /DNA_START=77 /DNA_END=300 /DNA_ORIENTATION=-
MVGDIRSQGCQKGWHLSANPLAKSAASRASPQPAVNNGRNPGPWRGYNGTYPFNAPGATGPASIAACMNATAPRP